MRVKVGMKAKGFKFKGGEHLGYSPDMDKYIGKQGVIESSDDRKFSIRFEDEVYWNYPIALEHRAFISVGDKVKIPKTKSVGDSIEKSNNIAIARSDRQDYLYYKGEKDGKLVLNCSSEDIYGSGDYFTLEDIELYKEENMRTIKKSELEKIHNVACSTWQVKIKEMANRNPFGDSVELTQEEIDIMFRASSVSQTEVLEEVFGKQNKEINLFSRDVNHIVDGLPVFGGSLLSSTDALISLPLMDSDGNRFYLNPNYKWELKEYALIVTRI
jgi:hypothetical protein